MSYIKHRPFDFQIGVMKILSSSFTLLFALICITLWHLLLSTYNASFVYEDLEIIRRCGIPHSIKAFFKTSIDQNFIPFLNGIEYDLIDFHPLLSSLYNLVFSSLFTRSCYGPPWVAQWIPVQMSMSKNSSPKGPPSPLRLNVTQWWLNINT